VEVILSKAGPEDATGLSGVLAELAAAGKRRKSGDAQFVLHHYIAHAHQIRCTVASTPGGQVLGFQSLKSAWAGNPYEVATGWGIIGTHIRPSAARTGIGRALFEVTLDAARRHGLDAIDATIGVENAEGLGYCGAMGFKSYRRLDGAMSKVYRLK